MVVAFYVTRKINSIEYTNQSTGITNVILNNSPSNNADNYLINNNIHLNITYTEISLTIYVAAEI